MAPASDVVTPTPRLARACTGLAGWATRRPWLVLAMCLISLVASILLASSRLKYRTQRDDLMSARKECHQRWQRYLREFGPDDDVVFVIEGTDRVRIIAALESIAAALHARPDQFDRLFWKVGLSNLRDRSLLLLPRPQLDQVRAQVAAMGPLLGPLGPLAWERLGLQALLDQGRTALVKAKTGDDLTLADHGLLERLGPIAHAAAEAIGGRQPSTPLWGGLVTASRGPDSDLLDGPRYFFSKDGSLAFLLARPVKANDQSFTPASEAVRTARAVIDEQRRRFPELSFGLTGLPVLENDEMTASDEDSMLAAWLALAGVGLLYLVVYRGLRYPLLTMATLLTGTVWALGLTTVTVGYLTILSATFAVMLIGLGDYGVLWVARYEDER